MWLLISLCVVGALASGQWPQSTGKGRRPGRRASRSADADVSRWATAESTSCSPSGGADTVKEVSKDFDVVGPLLPHRQVSALLETNEFGSLNSPMNALGDAGCDFVVPTHRDQGRDMDGGELVRHVPILDRADDREFVRAVHREVAGPAQVLEAVCDLAGPDREATHIPPVEHVDRGEVFVVLVVLEGLVFRNRRPDLRGQSIHKPPHLADRQGNAREASRHDQASQVPLILQRSRDCERASVARSHQMDLPEAKRSTDALDLLDVVGDCVKARATRAVGLPATQLVDEHDPIPKLGQVLEGQKIVVGGTGSAMQAEDGAFRRLSTDAIEEVEPENLDVTLTGFHGCNARRWIRTLPDDCLGPRRGRAPSPWDLTRMTMSRLARAAWPLRRYHSSTVPGIFRTRSV